MEIVTGYHYSDQVILPGEILYSHQTTATSYGLVWTIYKEMAKTLGIVLPKAYGYAYEKKPPHMAYRILNPSQSTFCYQVTAPAETIVRGNLNYSVYVTMGNLGALTDRGIVVLADRLKARNHKIMQNALRYFTWLEDPDKVEMISDAWVVQN